MARNCTSSPPVSTVSTSVSAPVSTVRPVSTMSVPVTSVPSTSVPLSAPASTVPSPVPSSVPVTSVPSTSVLSVLVSPVPTPTVQSSVTNFQVPDFPVSPDVPLEDGEIAMSSEPSEAGASPSKPVRPSTVPRVTPANDYKKLVRLVLPKVKPGSVSSTVKKLCLSLVKTHKLNVSDDECARIATSVCSKS